MLRAAVLISAMALVAPGALAGDSATDWTKAEDVAAALRTAVRVEVGDTFHRWHVPVSRIDAQRRLARTMADSLRPSDDDRFEAEAGVTFVLPDGTPVHGYLARGVGRMYLRNPDTGGLRTFRVAPDLLEPVWEDVERGRFREVATREQLDALPEDTLAVAVADPKLLPGLERLSGLRALSLYGAVTGDDDLALIPVLPQLEYLYLRGNSGYGSNTVTDAGAVHLARLTTLTSLLVGGTDIGDEGLRQLAALRRLERLEVDGCANVTAAGLANRLTTLPALRDLDLRASEGVLLEDLAKLAPALTQCRIVLPWGERTTGRALPGLLSELEVVQSFTGVATARRDDLHTLVRDDARWRTVWTELRGDEPPPDVDFAQQAVLVVVTEPLRVFEGMTLTPTIRGGEHQVTYHVTGPSGVDPGKRQLYGLFVLPKPRRAIRLFASHKAGPGPAHVEQQAHFNLPR